MLEASSKFQQRGHTHNKGEALNRRGFKVGEVEGNTSKLNGVPCAWCGDTEKMDIDKRFDCENENPFELFTLHKKCYKFIIGNWPKTDVLQVLYQAQLRKDNNGTI